jgi:hypothetical protein
MAGAVLLLLLTPPAPAAEPAGAPTVPADQALAAVTAGVRGWDGATLRREAARVWVAGRRPDGRPAGPTGTVQEVEWRGVAVRVQAAAFASPAAAREAALLHTQTVAAVFQSGAWPGAGGTSCGDETWWTRGPDNLAVLLRIGRVCVLVGCHGGDESVRAAAAREAAGRAAGRTAGSKP